MSKPVGSEISAPPISQVPRKREELHRPKKGSANQWKQRDSMASLATTTSGGPGCLTYRESEVYPPIPYAPSAFERDAWEQGRSTTAPLLPLLPLPRPQSELGANATPPLLRSYMYPTGFPCEPGVSGVPYSTFSPRPDFVPTTTKSEECFRFPPRVASMPLQLGLAYEGEADHVREALSPPTPAAIGSPPQPHPILPLPSSSPGGIIDAAHRDSAHSASASWKPQLPLGPDTTLGQSPLPAAQCLGSSLTSRPSPPPPPSSPSYQQLPSPPSYPIHVGAPLLSTPPSPLRSMSMSAAALNEETPLSPSPSSLPVRRPDDRATFTFAYDHHQCSQAQAESSYSCDQCAELYHNSPAALLVAAAVAGAVYITAAPMPCASEYQNPKLYKDIDRMRLVDEEELYAAQVGVRYED